MIKRLTQTLKVNFDLSLWVLPGDVGRYIGQICEMQPIEDGGNLLVSAAFRADARWSDLFQNVYSSQPPLITARGQSVTDRIRMKRDRKQTPHCATDKHNL